MKDKARKTLEYALEKKLDDAYAEWEDACSEELISEAADRAGIEDWESDEFCNAYDEVTSEIWASVIAGYHGENDQLDETEAEIVRELRQSQSES